MFEEHTKNGPFMWEVQIGEYLFGREIRYVSMTSEYGYPDWVFLYESEKRDARDVIWQGWAWERVIDVVATDEY